MDTNDLFDGIAWAFRRYRQKIAVNEDALRKGTIGLIADKKPKKTEKNRPKRRK